MSTTAAGRLDGRVAGFAAALFLAAFLVFSVQPMFARMALPLLGGAPAVWNTAMVFFQGALLAGYAYAHLLATRLAPRRQPLVHLAVLGAAALVLPIAVAAGWQPPAEATPIPWLLALLAVSVGAPFVAVAATAPLLQTWFAHSGHGRARDPYFLYAASNLGSIVALIGYPVAIEPWLGLARQSLAWTAGYGALAVAILGCGWALLRGRAALPAAVADGAPPVPWAMRLDWLVLAFAPSALLVAVTAHISADVAAAPFLWVVPLSLYLLTFVLVFARRPLLRQRWMVRLQPFVILPLALFFEWKFSLWFVFALHLGGFFVTAMVCHGELAARRPEVRHLTAFYLWMSLGGVLGGAFAALLAPVVFSGVYEYPLALVLACALRPRLDDGPAWRWLDLALPAALAAVAVPLIGGALKIETLGLAGVVAAYVGVSLVFYSFRKRPLRFGLGVAAVLAATVVATQASNVIGRDRSFFGVYRVKTAAAGAAHLFVYGTTVHGAQWLAPGRRREPLAYYARSGPLGDVFAARDAGRRFARVGAVGLGIGVTACYRRPGEAWTFYEIDPTVAAIARDARYFSYLADCAPEARIVFGDARLRLARQAAGAFDLLILDAFSSDAIPIHLMTREALALYLRTLAPGGWIAVHVSNRTLDLVPVVAALAGDAGIAGVYRFHAPAGDRAKTLIFPSTWVVLARDAGDLAPLVAAGWKPLAAEPGARPWTDDYANLIGAIRW